MKIIPIPHCVGCRHGFIPDNHLIHFNSKEYIKYPEGVLKCNPHSSHVNVHAKTVDAYDCCEHWQPAILTWGEDDQ